MALSAVHEDLRCGFTAVQHQRLDRFTLHERLRVREERLELPQSLVAAKLAQQERRRTSHFPVGRVHQPLHGLAAGRAERDQHIAQPPARSRVLLGRQDFRERHDERRADGVAQPLEALELVVVAAAQVFPDVLHHRAVAEAQERRLRRRTAAGAIVRFRCNRIDQTPGVVEMADAHEIVRVGRHRVGNVAPPWRVALDRQQVDEQGADPDYGAPYR